MEEKTNNKVIDDHSSSLSDVKQQPKNININRQNQILSRDELSLEEYYITRHYSSVLESIGIFKDDPLVNKPGSKFLYTTHGWTLISAVVEKVAKKPFEKYLQKILDDLGMENTYLEEAKPLIYNRGRHYVKGKRGRLENAPYVDLSYKWAGGGLLSNVLDVTKFGNAMLYSYQSRLSETDSNRRTSTGDHNSHLPGFLKPDTMKQIWTQVAMPEPKWEGISKNGYGLGWSVCSRKNEYAFCREKTFFVSHSGGAIGASSVLLIFPTETSGTGNIIEWKEKSEQKLKSSKSVPAKLPKGVVVTIIVNMSSVGLVKTAYDIAGIFKQMNMGK